jgi:hypothetical protein
VNPLTGLVTVTLYATDIYNLEQGNYSYSIIMQQRTILDSNNYIVTSSKVLYIDSQYGAIGLLDIYGDVLGTIKDSLVVDTFNYINPLDRGVTTIPKNYTSSIINAHPELSTPLSLYTFQFYFTNYTGIVVIQGSIENQGSTPHIWADIVTVNPLLDTIVNVIGKYSWFRIYHQPLTGTLDKVLFR